MKGNKQTRHHDKWSPWAALSAVFFGMGVSFVACNGPTNNNQNCPEVGGGGHGTGGEHASTGGGGSGTGNTMNTGGTGGIGTDTITTTTDDGSSAEDNTFDHFNDPIDPFQLHQQQLEEGPPEIRTRLHSCTKLSYSALGDFLTSRGVDLAKTGTPDTAGELYTKGKDSLGVANYDAREAETYFHTTAGATRLFDIFVMASQEMIDNIQNAPACQIAGVGKPMFDADTGECVFESFSCIMGRPMSNNDMELCNTMLKHAAPGDSADLAVKRRVTVAAFLSAGHTCE